MINVIYLKCWLIESARNVLVFLMCPFGSKEVRIGYKKQMFSASLVILIRILVSFSCYFGASWVQKCNTEGNMHEWVAVLWYGVKYAWSSIWRRLEGCGTGCTANKFWCYSLEFRAVPSQLLITEVFSPIRPHLLSVTLLRRQCCKWEIFQRECMSSDSTIWMKYTLCFHCYIS